MQKLGVLEGFAMNRYKPSVSEHGRMPVNTLRLTLVLGSLTAFAPFATDMYLSSFPTLAEHYSTDIESVQLSLSMFFLGLSAGQLFYGPLIDYFGRKPPLLAGTAIFILSSLLITIAPGIDSFICLRLIQAVGGCAGMIVSRAVVNDLFDAREGAKMLSTLMLVTGLGPVIAPIAGSYLLAAAGWQSIFAFLAVFGIGCFLATAFGLKETLEPNQRAAIQTSSILKAYLHLILRRDFMAPLLAGSFGFCGLFAFITASPSIFMDLHGVSQATYGWLFAINAMAMIIASQLNNMLLKRFSMSQVLLGAIVFNVLTAIALLSVYDSDSLVVLMVPLWFCLATVPLITANSIALAMSVSGDHSGSASALIGVAQFGFAAIVSGIISAVHDGTALPMAVVILAAGLLAMAAWVLGARFSKQER